MADATDDFHGLVRDLFGDLSDVQVAKMTGLSQPWINQIRNHGRMPSYKALVQISNGLKIDADTRRRLFQAAGYVEPKAPPPQEDENAIVVRVAQETAQHTVDRLLTELRGSLVINEPLRDRYLRRWSALNERYHDAGWRALPSMTHFFEGAASLKDEQEMEEQLARDEQAIVRFGTPPPGRPREPLPPA